jgi:hypothetical protein
VQFKLNTRLVEIEPQRIMNVAELQRRMSNGAVVYWTMVKPAHAVLYDPSTDTVAQIAFFSKLWGLQRGDRIRHDHYDGIYQVFVPTTPSREKHSVAEKVANEGDTPFAHSSPVKLTPDVIVDVGSVQFVPSI